VRGVEGDFAVKSFVGLQVVCNVINLVECDAGAIEAKLDGSKRKTTGIIHSDVPDARKFLFFDRRYYAAILDQRGGCVAFLT
jgi:hypothetical protein